LKAKGSEETGYKNGSGQNSSTSTAINKNREKEKEQRLDITTRKGKTLSPIVVSFHKFHDSLGVKKREGERKY